MSGTILALATPPGPGARAVLRLSGPDCARIVREAVGHAGSLPAEVRFWRGPRSYTGEDMAEVHCVSCPPLVDLLAARLLEAGCRAAGPGEFTQRAFLAGKLDLTRAEAVQAVIAAESRDDLKAALGQLAGGIAHPLAALREDLLDLLADVEAGLDFSEEGISFIASDALLLRLGRAMAQVANVQKRLDSRSAAGSAFRAVLAGKPNAGKSSLFNALAGTRALVSAEPGTTRDWLSATIDADGVRVELVDTPGTREAADGIEAQAQGLGQSQRAGADLVAWCAESAEDAPAGALLVATKCDLRPAAPG
ncbi:MAG: 50S ribosome-binding GTPase, partial [Gemmataceae bacterium]|nr:50S ribosome-binding GTPase [Gemmataceae bacterium]